MFAAVIVQVLILNPDSQGMFTHANWKKYKKKNAAEIAIFVQL